MKTFLRIAVGFALLWMLAYGFTLIGAAVPTDHDHQRDLVEMAFTGFAVTAGVFIVGGVIARVSYLLGNHVISLFCREASR